MAGHRHTETAESGKGPIAPTSLTARMRYALRLMYESIETEMAVTITQPTRPVTGPSAFVNVRTARALQALGLARFSYGGAHPSYEWLSLTDAGRELAATLPDGRGLARMACPVCGSQVSVRNGGELLAHPDPRDAPHSVPAARHGARAAQCAGSGRVFPDERDIARGEELARQHGW